MQIDKEKAAEIIKMLRAGAGLEAAAVVVGVEPYVAKNWHTAGLAYPDGPCGDFARRVEQTRASLLAQTERTVFQNAIDARDSATAKWLLAKLAPEKYGEKGSTQLAATVVRRIIRRLRQMRDRLNAEDGDAILAIETLIEELDGAVPPSPKQTKSPPVFQYPSPVDDRDDE